MNRLFVTALFLAGCDGSAEPPPDALHFDPVTSGCAADWDPGRELDDALFAYEWTCRGDVAPTGRALVPTGDGDGCPGGTWPALPPASICPTQSTTTRLDPVSGQTLPPADVRALPMQLAPQEAGSFLASPASSYPSRIKVVAWNMEYTASLDRQLEVLTTDPRLADADVYLLNEVDRCTLRNGERRAARELARAIGGDYVYAVEFVELDIGRTIHGDTGQAIVSRRPLSGAEVLCHSSQNDWFANTSEPRLGQRVRLAADIPAGETSVRVNAIHLESSDLTGEKRVVQARELLDSAQAEACDRPQVIAGDWNAWYCTAPELEVLRRSGFVDATRIAGDVEPTHERGSRLDMIWGRGVRVLEGGVIRGLGVSDHDVLWAVLEIE